MPEQIYQCREGHYFLVRSWLKLLVASVHFGGSKYLRCPVDHHWQMATRVNSNDLSEDQLAQAHASQY